MTFIACKYLSKGTFKALSFRTPGEAGNRQRLGMHNMDLEPRGEEIVQNKGTKAKDDAPGNPR